MGNSKSKEAKIGEVTLTKKELKVVREQKDKRFKKIKVVSHAKLHSELFLVEQLIDAQEGKLASEKINEMQAKGTQSFLSVQGNFKNNSVFIFLFTVLSHFHSRFHYI